jgi:hypothetical protein
MGHGPTSILRDARKSALLRMTAEVVATCYVNKNPPSTVTTLPVM